MIISDLSHFKVISEAASVVGGESLSSLLAGLDIDVEDVKTVVYSSKVKKTPAGYLSVTSVSGITDDGGRFAVAGSEALA